MHYLIDGYNLLFSLIQEGKNLQSKREAIIRDLNVKASSTKLNVSIVFDAAYHSGGPSRFHFDALEILYTAEGESADDYIINKIQYSSEPQQETVVTSDKALGRKVRHFSGKTETVEHFLDWLDRSFHNKISKKKVKKTLALSIPQTEISSINTPLEELTEHYLKIFESEWKEIQQKEKEEKALKASLSPKRAPRKPRQKKDPFQEPLTPEKRKASEMERWLTIFVDRLND